VRIPCAVAAQTVAGKLKPLESFENAFNLLQRKAVAGEKHLCYTVADFRARPSARVS
jgi:hypothetical protein